MNLKAAVWPELAAAVDAELRVGADPRVCPRWSVATGRTQGFAPTAEQISAPRVDQVYQVERRIDEIGEQFGAGAQERCICRDR